MRGDIFWFSLSGWHLTESDGGWSGQTLMNKAFLSVLPHTLHVFHPSHPPVHLFWWRPSINKESVLSFLFPILLYYLFTHLAWLWRPCMVSRWGCSRSDLGKNNWLHWNIRTSKILSFFVAKCKIPEKHQNRWWLAAPLKGTEKHQLSRSAEMDWAGMTPPLWSFYWWTPYYF